MQGKFFKDLKQFKLFSLQVYFSIINSNNIQSEVPVSACKCLGTAVLAVLCKIPGIPR